MAKVIKYAALAVLAASTAEAFTGSALTGLTPKLRNSAVATRAAKSHGPDMSLVVVTGARCIPDKPSFAYTDVFVRGDLQISNPKAL